MEPNTPPRRWVSSSLATTGLLVMTLLVSAFTLSAALPTADTVRLPAPVTAFGITRDTVLMERQIEAIPLGSQWSGLLRVTLAPGAVWELGRQRYVDDGPMLYRVISGALTLQAEHPISITPAGTADAQTLLPPTDVVLHPGAHGFTPAGVRSSWRNTGDEPVEVLQVRLSVIGFDDTCLSPPPGVTISPLIKQRKKEPPAPPVVVTVRQVTLDARAVLPVEAVPGLELLYVVSGTLSVHDPPQADEPTSLLIPRVDGLGRPIDTGAAATGSFRPGRVLRSSADEATVLLLVTMAPAEPATDASSAEGATPRSVLRDGTASCSAGTA